MIETLPIDAVMRALADSTRRSIFERIATRKEVSVGELTEGSGVTQGAISQHLRTLKIAGLVTERPEGRKVFYRTAPQGLTPLIDWMSCYDAFWKERFADLRALLKEIDP